MRGGKDEEDGFGVEGWSVADIDGRWDRWRVLVKVTNEGTRGQMAIIHGGIPTEGTHCRMSMEVP